MRREITRNIALGTIAAGSVLFVAGVFGVAAHDFAILLAYIGPVALLAGTVLLIVASKPFRFAAPHPLAIAVCALALGLHGYANVYDYPDPHYFFFVWSLIPYVLCLALSAFAATRVPAIAGAVVAFAFDLWTYYGVAPSTSAVSAALALLWTPIWNTLVVVPLATFVAWLIASTIRRAGVTADHGG